MKNKQLFFDDEKLFLRENVRRCLGKAELIPDSVYHDGVCETIFCSGWAFKIGEKYRCVYFGMCADGVARVFCAESKDGIRFTPEDVSGCTQIEHPIAAHQILEIPGEEIADIYEDKTACPEQRYKMLVSHYNDARKMVEDPVYYSDDLIHWHLLENARWSDGAEPLACVFYNEKKQCHTILHRPYWGIRKVGYQETKDFMQLEEYHPCLHQDGYDAPLAEIYGMKALPYGGMFVGLAVLYTGIEGCLHSKYKGGREEAQLTYSADGRYWLRSLHEPFVSGKNDIDTIGYDNKMVWVSQIRQAENGDILILTSATPEEHGNFVPGTHGTMQTYRVREDGFVFLTNEDASKPAAVATRDKLWHGGEAHINLAAKYATFAVYETAENEDGNNVLSFSRPIPGMGHEDCVPFSGDSTDWVPTFKSGKTMNDLAGKTLLLEVRFTEGKLYGIGGDFTDLFNVDAFRYRWSGVLPENER